MFVVYTDFSIPFYNQNRSIRDWKQCRQKWKGLNYLAINLTNSVYGEILLLHIICYVAPIVFVLFLYYFLGYKQDNHLAAFLLIVKIFVGVLWLFELFQQCQNCKFKVTNNHL